MNDEIKEINIKIPGQILDYVDTTEHLLELYNYITNLQQENERLKKLEYKFIDTCGENESFTLEEYLDIGNKLYDSEREKEDYKSRCEKAVEYINNCPEYLWANVNTKVLLNILNVRVRNK